MILSTSRFTIVSIPTARSSCSSFSKPGKSFQLVDVRVSVMPYATARSTKSFITAGGSFTKVPDPCMPPWRRKRVRRKHFVPSRTHSQGFCFCSRTYFLIIVEQKNSSDSNPARSIASATASIVPVLIPSAQRLCCPSRSVVSIKCTSLMVKSRSHGVLEW